MQNVYNIAPPSRIAEHGKRKLAPRTLTKAQKAEAIRRLKTGVAAVSEAPAAAKRPRPTKPRESEATTTAGKAVAVRLAPAEVAALDALQTRIGATSRSDALRALVRSSTGMLELPAEDAARLAEIKAELHKIGVNVNQIALAANRGRIDLARQDWTAITELRQALPGLRSWLGAVVDESRRRGIRLFRAFLEAERGERG